MAEPESILQLGIEAAREGNRAEARNLFRLLTRQAPDDPQGWLWLAGVAADREERLAALKRVMALDPDNALAARALQAMGAAQGNTPVPPPAVRDAAEPPVLQPTTALQLDDWAAEPIPAIDAAPKTSRISAVSGDLPDLDDQQRTLPPLPALDADLVDEDEAPAVDRPRPHWFPRTRPGSPTADDALSDEDEAAPRRTFPLMLAVVTVAAVVVIGIALALLPELMRTPTEVAGLPTQPAATDAATVPAEQPTSAVLPTVPPLPTLEPTAEPTPATLPTAAPTSLPDPAAAQPAAVAVGTTLSAEGWQYSFPLANYAAPLGPTVGGNASKNGTYVLVLMFVANGTAADSVLPSDFVVLKDAQGRVWRADQAASVAYTVPGVNADVSLSIPIPANNVTTSVAVVFDVAADATNLMLFAPANPASGWVVLATAQ